MRLYLIRHGETDWNKVRRIQGSSDISLNEYGRELARLTRDGLKKIPFDIAFTSPLDRAVETGKIILEGRNIPLHKDQRLAEADFGEYEGILEEELEKKEDCFLDFFNRPEAFQKKAGAEDHNDVIERAADFLMNVVLPGEKNYEHMAVFSHGALIHGMLTKIYQREVKHFWHPPRQENCGVSVVEITDGTCRVLEESTIFYSLKK